MVDDELRYEFTWLTQADQRSIAEVIDLIETVSATDPFIGLPTRPSTEDITQLSAKLVGGLASGQTHLLAVRDSGGRVVGCVAMNRALTANQRHIGELTTGAVHPDCRGRGVVTVSFAEIVRRCEQVGIELLKLDVRAGIKAEQLWRSYGFEEYGRLADYGRIGDESYAGIYMVQPVGRLKNMILNREVVRAEQR
jgi:ribosomal protein S18 acetylase RimI-like enzyme